MNSKIFFAIISILGVSCGVKAPPKPKNDNFPSFIEQNKKVLRPKSLTKSNDKKEENKKSSKQSNSN
ncbi:putative lipoprotein [Bacteriovorax sp. BAL6_X]|uniref:hypothetical protein n=1 Tax=Bacteriovorax sp. BAL6_X TaxID=1201290 RepID=UPI000385D343|nr:hypothetical protein [Bacteriovorax sp. BAL6_X]EPZ50591.1 putative lipoprotein [Bacteriovorax sp. BAL6_X]